MQPENGSKPNLAAIVEKARETGATDTANRSETRRGKIGELKTIALNTFNEARRKYNEFRTKAGEIRQKTVDVKDVVKGFAISPDIRNEFARLVQDRAEQVRDRVDSRAHDIRENAFNKAENTLLSAQNRMHEAVQNAQNNFRADVAEARAIARGIQNGGREVVSFFRNQGEQAVNNARANMYDSIADFRKLQALPDRAISRVFGGIASFFQERTDKSNDRITNRTAQSTNLNNTANALRMRSAPAGA